MLRATRDGYPTVGLGYLLAGRALIDGGVVPQQAASRTVMPKVSSTLGRT